MTKKGFVKRLMAGLLCVGVLVKCGACGAQNKMVDSPTPVPTAEPRIEPTAVPTEEVLQPTSVPTDADVTIEPTATSTPAPTATKAPTSTPKPTATVTPVPTATKAPTSTPKPTATATPIPTETKVPTPTVAVESATMSGGTQGRAPEEDMTCSYRYSELSAVKKQGILSDDSYMKSEGEVYKHFLKQVRGRANTYVLTFGAVNSDVVEAAAKRLAKLPGMVSIEVEKTEYWSNAAAFNVTISHVPEFAHLYAWKMGDTSELSRDGIALLNKAKALVAEANQLNSNYEKVVYFHDYLVLNTIYDMSESDTVGQTAYGALIEGRCVCMGYTNAFHMLLTMAGIDCLIVYGDAGGQSHAWTKVWIDDAWYNVDVTWDDPIPDTEGKVNYVYLNVTDEFLAETHTWDNTDLPTASATKYCHIQRVFPTFETKEDLISYCKDCLAEGAEEVQFIMTDDTLSLSSVVQTIVEELQVGVTYRYKDCQGGVWYEIIFEQ